MFDELKTHEWWFLGLAAVAGYPIVRHFIEKFSGDQPTAGSASGSAPGSGPGPSPGHGTDHQQHDNFKHTSDSFRGAGDGFSSKHAQGEQSEWFRRGQDRAEQHAGGHTGKRASSTSGGRDGRDTGNESGKPYSPPPRPWYQVLEVSSMASLDEVKRAYQRKIRQYHPDKVAGLGPEFTEIANVKAKEINLATNRDALRAAAPGR